MEGGAAREETEHESEASETGARKTKNSAVRGAPYGIPMMPAPTMELTRLEEAPRTEDFFLGHGEVGQLRGRPGGCERFERGRPFIAVAFFLAVGGAIVAAIAGGGYRGVVVVVIEVHVVEAIS